MTSELNRTLAYVREEIDEGLHVGAQIYVSLGGRVVADLGLGLARPGVEMEPDTLVAWLSAGKPLTAVLLARLWERGLLDVDDPVSRHVPEFARGGKGKIKVRHLLTHTSGLALYNLRWVERGWEELLRDICDTQVPPDFRPGHQAAYDPQANWLVLGEVVRRVAAGAGLLKGNAVQAGEKVDPAEQFAALMQSEVFEPVGMKECWLGVPRARYEAYGERMALFYETGRSAAEGGPQVAPWDTPERAAAVSPGGGARGPVRELGRFYEMLLRHGRAENGEQVLLSPTVSALTSRQRVEMMDATFRHKVDWAFGFLVESSRYGMETVPYGYGRHASKATFGHGGMQSTTAFADPEHGLVVAATFNGHPGEARHSRRVREFNSRVYEDLGLA